MRNEGRMMLNDKIIIAGFGGQGVLRIGQMIAYAGLDEGHEVTWVPSYGSEMRGGTANCSVIVSERIIASPAITMPDIAIVMNRPSLIKFEKTVKPGGKLIVNSSLIADKAEREDIQVYYVPANEIALADGNDRGANMVALGAYVALTGDVKLESLCAIVDKTFTGRKQKFAASNKRLLQAGFDYIGQHYGG